MNKLSRLFFACAALTLAITFILSTITIINCGIDGEWLRGLWYARDIAMIGLPALGMAILLCIGATIIGD